MNNTLPNDVPAVIRSLISMADESVMADAVRHLVNKVPNDKLVDALNKYHSHAEYLGLDDALGFLYDYLNLSKYLSNHGYYVHHKDDTGMRVDRVTYRVIDVGCASGIQHAFFDNYVGVDYRIPEKWPVFHSGASFMEGQFSRLIESGELVIDPDRDFGIANMSLLYGGHDAELFKSIFKRCVII